MEITNESIFVSTVRSFCKVFFSAVGLLLAGFVATIIYTAFSSPYLEEEKTSIELLPNLDGELGLSLSAPVILQINIDGEIGIPRVLDANGIKDVLFDSRQGILANRVKGILLLMNTPGGGATESDNIYRMLKAYKEKYKVPIYAYVDGLCASGGMLISSAADKMYASPPSIIGSVGVISGPYFNVAEALTRYGVETKMLTQGIDKDALTPFRHWEKDEGANWKSLMHFFYNRFVDIVTSAHPRLSREKLVGEYGARVFSCPDAMEKGYIDVADAEYNTALSDLMSAAGVDATKPYQVVQLKPKGRWFGPMASKLGILDGKVEHSFNFGEKKFKEPFAYYYDPAGVAL